MKDYNVRLPLLAVINVTVEAENEKEAIEKAKEKALQMEAKFKGEDCDCEEWDIYDKIVQGNFYLGSINEAEATEF